MTAVPRRRLTLVVWVVVTASTVAHSQQRAASPGESTPALISAINRIDMAMSLDEVRAAYPQLSWVDAPNRMENRHELVANPGVTLAGRPFNLTLAAGTTGLHQVFAIWGDHKLQEKRCLDIGSEVVAELEKEFGPLAAAPASASFAGGLIPVRFSTMRAGSGSQMTIRKLDLVKLKTGLVGGYVEWQSIARHDDGVELEAGGTFHGTSSLLGEKGDCSAWAKIRNARVEPRRVEEVRSLITSRASGAYVAGTRPSADQCAANAPARDSNPEAYSVYAGCVIDSFSGAFYSLYSRHLRNFPNDTQDVDVKFRVGASGKPENVVASAPALTDQELVKKVAARLTVIAFVPPKDAEYEVSYTFRFTQAEP